MCKQRAPRGRTPSPTRLRLDSIRTWLRFKVQEITVPVMIGALQIRRTYDLSYWDAAIIAAARAVGCREVLSEDMSHGREIEGITISNPFR